MNTVKNQLQLIQTKGLKGALFDTPSLYFDEAAIRKYNRAIDTGKTAQKALAIASKNTNQETIALMKSMNGAAVSEEKLQKAQKASTVAAKAQSVALGAATAAANMLIFALISKGIQAAMDAIDRYVHRAEYAAQALKEAQQEISESQSNLRSMSATLAENQDRFLELSNGVYQFSKNLIATI